MVALTEEKTDKQRDIKTKHKPGRHTYYIYCHADIQIYYNERALTALKRYTFIAQAGHFNYTFFVYSKISYIRTTISHCQAGIRSYTRGIYQNILASV